MISIPPPPPDLPGQTRRPNTMAEKVIPLIFAPQLLFLHHSSSDISTWCHPKMTFFMDESKYSPVMLPIKSGIFPGELGKGEF